MQYAIMRMNKLKGLNATARSLQHNFREVETPNADAGLSNNNIHSASGTDEAMGVLRERLSSLERKPRKDAVTCVEYLMTASPEWFSAASEDEKEQFFDGSRKWLEDKYGKENIVSFSIHQDETTPHISAHIVPITKDGRLSAKELIGAKKQMQEDQTTFAAQHEHIGLERGVKGSKAVHQDIKAYYASVNKAKNEERQIRERFNKAIPDKKLLESSENYKKRIAQNLNEEFKTLQQKASITTEYARTEQKAKKIAVDAQNEKSNLARQKNRLEIENDKYQKILNNLVLAVGGQEKAKQLLDKVQEQKEQEAQKKKLEQQEKVKQKRKSQSRGFSR